MKKIITLLHHFPMRRAVAMLLLAVMLFSVSPASAFAEDDGNDTEVVMTEVTEVSEVTEAPEESAAESTAVPAAETEATAHEVSETETPESEAVVETVPVESEEPVETEVSATDETTAVTEPDAESEIPEETEIPDETEVQEAPVEETETQEIPTEEKNHEQELTEEPKEAKSAGETTVEIQQSLQQEEDRHANGPIIPIAVSPLDKFFIGITYKDIFGGQPYSSALVTKSVNGDYGPEQRTYLKVAGSYVSYNGSGYYVGTGGNAIILYCNYGPCRFIYETVNSSNDVLAVPIRPSQEDGFSYTTNPPVSTTTSGTPAYQSEKIGNCSIPVYSNATFDQVDLVYAVTRGLSTPGLVYPSASNKYISSAANNLINNIVYGYIGLGSDGAFHGLPLCTNNAEVNRRMVDILSWCEVYSKEKGMTGNKGGDLTVPAIANEIGYTAPNLSDYQVESGSASHSSIRTLNFTKTQSSGNQKYVWAVNVIKFKKVPTKGKFTLEKSCVNNSDARIVVANNSMYSLAGAKFEIHKGSANGPVVETVTTDANGKATSANEYDFGTVLYAVETAAPAGYLLDSTPYKLTISSDSSANKFEPKDVPTVDPNQLKFTKRDSDSGDVIQGAVFKVEFMGGKNAAAPVLRTWYFQTDAYGELAFDAAHRLASYNGQNSDELYQFNGGYIFPLGCARVTEIKAANGYATPSSADATIYLFIRQKSDGYAKSYWVDNNGARIKNGTTFGIYHMKSSSLTAVNDVIFTTYAVNAADNSKVLPPANNVKIKDTISYTGLTPGQQYTFVATLHDASTSGCPNLKVNGSYVTAKKSFVASEPSGTCELTFTFDASSLAGTTIVVYQALKQGDEHGQEIAAERKPDNADQSVVVGKPAFTTVAADADGNKKLDPLDSVKIYDTVSYDGLSVGKTYRFTATLHDASDGSTIKQNGSPISNTYEMKVTNDSQKSGTCTIKLSFDASKLEGKKVVIYQALQEINEDGTKPEVAAERDRTNKNQTVEIVSPAIDSLASAQNGTHVSAPLTSFKITDTVTYKNLVPGNEYYVKGVLWDKNANKELKVNGKSVTAKSAVFTAASKGKGTVKVVYEFDGSELLGKDIVVYERLYRDGYSTALAVHEDPNDEDQTITVPKPSFVSAAENKAGTVYFDPLDEGTVTDTVTYKNVVPGTAYKLVGKLKIKGTDKFVTDADGSVITVTKKFTPTEANGSVALDFNFSPSKVRNEITSESSVGANIPVVVFQTLYVADGSNWIEVYKEEDESIKKQTVNVRNPKLKTSAAGENGTQYESPKETVEIVDTVTFSGLIMGRDYVIKGALMVRNDDGTCEPLVIDGEPVTAECEMLDSLNRGTAPVTFSFPGKDMLGKTVVVFEELYRVGHDEPIAVHKDPNDTKQTIYFREPTFTTTATNAEDGSKLFDPLDEVTLHDTIVYKNLVPETTTYIFVGSIFNKTKGEFLKNADGEKLIVKHEFTPEAADGTETVESKFSATELKGQDLVVYQELRVKSGNIKVQEEKDSENADQTVHVTGPDIQTEAKNPETEGNTLAPKTTVTIVDTVSYQDLIPGKEYTIKGVLMDKATGEPLLIDGEKVTAETEPFRPTESNGTVTVTFVFNGLNLIGKELVVFETLYYEEQELAVHADITDEKQTVTFPVPELHTTAVAADEDGLKVFDPMDKVVLVDTIEYTNLVPGVTYKAIGTIMVKTVDEETGEVSSEPLTDADGNVVTAETAFVPETANGSIDVTFEFDASKLKGKTLVVFEEIWTVETDTNGDSVETVKIGEHKDINDDDQTVTVTEPKIQTEAKNAESGGNTLAPTTTVTIVDTVSYTGLIPGHTYVIKGVLMRKDTGEELVVNGGPVTAESGPFTPETSDGTVTVTFKFEGLYLLGEELVAFETLYRDDVELAVHADITDEKQTTNFPNGTIQTTATNSEDGSKEFDPLEKVMLIDEIKYENLVPGTKYRIDGKIYIKETGKFLCDENGNEITSFVEFIPKTENGTETAVFTFNASLVAGLHLVVFERCIVGDTGVEVAKHEDPNDEGQTVRVHAPKIETNATSDNGTHYSAPKQTVTITDHVTYHDLIPGKEYTLKGILMDKATNKPLLVDGKEVTASATFKPETADGSIDITFTFSGVELLGRTTVVFERLYREEQEIAVHTDIEDAPQTVTFPEPIIGTKASAAGKNTAKPEKVVLTDVVSYEGLVVGEEYKVVGVLMDKETGKPVLIDGKEVTAEATFVAKEADGTVEMIFEFDASTLAGKEIVVFEKVYTAEGTLVGKHEDINDKDQTVEIEKEKPVAPPTYPPIAPPTGDSAKIGVYIALGILALAGIGIVVALLARKGKKEESENEEDED